MQFRTDGGYYVLALETCECLGTACALCKLICPVRAITLMPGAARAALTARTPQVLRSGALTVCGKCFTPFATEPGQLDCPVCRESERRQQALAAEIRKVTDESEKQIDG